MYIRNRLDKQDNTVSDPTSYVSKSEELKEFLAEIYSRDTADFDQDNQ